MYHITAKFNLSENTCIIILEFFIIHHSISSFCLHLISIHDHHISSHDIIIYSSLSHFLCPRPERSAGASSNQIFRLFVCLSVCLSVSNSVPLSNKVQYLKFGWWYSNQTWTVSSSIGSSHFTDIPCPWGWGRLGQDVGLRDFCHIWTLLPPGASVFNKHMSSFSQLPSDV